MRRTLVLALMLLVDQARAADDGEFHRIQLPNGIKAVIVEAPQAQRQTIMTFVPSTLVNDDARRAQWSHLLEHMVIRTTDPETLQAPGMEMNGETTYAYLRLDTYAEPKQWREAFKRHAKWLSAESFDPAMLEREKGNIAVEEQTTAAGGLTSKFALAAWNQVINHGVSHAAVHGDVAQATVEEVGKYARSRLRSLEGVVIATIGPAKHQDVQAALELLMGELKAGTPPPAGAPKEANIEDELLNKAQTATWDLPTRHFIMHWKLPDSTPGIRAAAFAAAGVLQMKLQLQRQKVDPQVIKQVLVYPSVRANGAEYFIIDCCLAEPCDPKLAAEQVQKSLLELSDAQTALQLFKWWLNMQLTQLRPPGGPAAMRKQLPAQVQHVAEGVWLLNIMNLEVGWHMEIDEIATAFKSIDEQACGALLNLLHDHERRWELLIEPATN